LAETSPSPSGRRRSNSITASPCGSAPNGWPASSPASLLRRAAREELAGLQRAEAAGASLVRTARSHLPRALDHVLRTSVVTARGLAEDLSITPQAALRLLRQLTASGVVREATGRAAWRAFTTA
jgi:ribosomal protein S25